MQGWLECPDGARCWWRLEGPPSGPTALLLPPGNRTAAIWPASWLADRHRNGWRTLRVDLPGQGRSVLGREGFDVDRLAADLVDLAPAAAGDGALHVVGAGLGGLVAMAMGEAGSAATLTLVATSGWYADPAMPGAEEPVMVALLLRQERHTPTLLRRALLREVRALAGPADVPHAGSWPETVDGWLAHGQVADDPHRRALLEAASRWDRLAGLAVPTTVVHGTDDPLLPPAHAERLAATIPGARLRLVDGAGHHLGPGLLAVLAASLDDLRGEGGL